MNSFLINGTFGSSFKRPAAILFLASALLAQGCDWICPEPEILGGIITGVVTDKLTGQTLQGVDVSITGPEAGQTVTGSQGIYRFEDITPGEYTVVFTKLGYRANTTITVVESGKPTNGQINLEPYTTLIASSYILDFGATQVSKSFTVFNPLAYSVSVSIQVNKDWISVTPSTSADISPGTNFPFSVSVDRAQMPQNGVNEGSITIQPTTNNIGSFVIQITAIK